MHSTTPSQQGHAGSSATKRFPAGPFVMALLIGSGPAADVLATRTLAAARRLALPLQVVMSTHPEDAQRFGLSDLPGLVIEEHVICQGEPPDVARLAVLIGRHFAGGG